MISTEHMKKYILFVTVVLLGVSCSNNDKSLKTNISSQSVIDSLINGIAMDNILNDEGIGIGWKENDQWKRYIRLSEIATEEELVELTDHENAVVRGYSFQALAKNKSSQVFPILINHLTDTAMVTSFSGCFKTDQMLGDYLIDVVTIDKNDTTDYKLDDREQAIVDIILLFDKSIQLSTRTNLLLKLPPKEEYYNRIKEILLEGDEDFALPLLAKYRKKADKKLIVEKLTSTNREDWYYGLMAVRNYPDPDFYPYLVELYNYEMTQDKGLTRPSIRILYQAIVQYKNKRSCDLIKQTLSEKDRTDLNYQNECIYLALTKYPNKIYNGLKELIKLTDLQLQDIEYSIDSDT